MALYRYVKAQTVQSDARNMRRVSNIASYGLIGMGFFVLAWVFWPIFSFDAISQNVFAGIISPIASSQNVQHQVKPVGVAYAASGGPQVTSPTEFTNVNAWYPAAPQKRSSSEVTSYTMSIPKLRVYDALVTISGDELEDTLVHYGGTGLPGQYGTAVIFGHSTLPQFYNPKSYKSIFSLLPTLENGDEILVNYDGVDYRYTVFDMIVKEATDLSVLDQNFSDSFISLITCVPPGTLWKRLHVIAKLNTL